MSNVIIPAEHASSPKQTDIEKALRTAAQEIHDGTFVAPADEFFQTETSELEQHPRVQDAMRMLEHQVQNKTAQEYLERAEMLHEMNANMVRGNRWEGQERWQGKENEEMRLVNIMSPRAFIEKLQAAGISAAIEPMTKTEMRYDGDMVLREMEVQYSPAQICLGKYVVRGVLGLFAWVKGEYRYVNKLQYPCGPEWTLMRFDEYNVPTNERYHGWRTALLALIREEVITEEQAHKAFGAPIENAASMFYRQQIFEFRSGMHRNDTPIGKA